MTSGWGDGYVTDIHYEAGYYREQSPGQLKLACLLSGVAWDVPEEGAHYVELGCGQGLGALIVAAANPSWRVTALDFNPAHIAGARALARDAGLDNISFLEADLATFAESPACAALPEADIVTAHGVWSWVSPVVRSGIVRLLRAKLRAGGVFHVSYNALPGWQGMLSVQRLVREAGMRLADRSDRQAQAGLAVLRELAAAEAPALRGDARFAGWLSDLPGFSPIYLAHELMNSHWTPCWHAEVAGALVEARLDWVGAATPIENFAELTMTTAQRAIYDRFEDPLMRELVKDMCTGRTLRHDVYVRGARRLSNAARDVALRALTLALTVPREQMQFEVAVAVGKAELAPAFYGPVADMLARGPARVGALLKAPGAVASRENPAELVGLFVGTRQGVLLMRPGAPAGEAATRLNVALARRFAQPESLNRGSALASAAIGGGLPCSMPDLYVASRLLAGDAGADVGPWLEELGGRLADDSRQRLQEALQRGRDVSVPIMRMVGCLPA